MFLQDDSAPVDAIEPTSHLTLDQVRIDQLWKERDDVIEACLERGYFRVIDYAEMESIVREIIEIEEGMED
jgi:hypothetical protein